MYLSLITRLSLLLMVGLVLACSETKDTTEDVPPEIKKPATGVAAIDAVIKRQLRDGLITKDTPNWKQNLFDPDIVPFDPETTYYWHLETSKGPIKIELWPHVAPHHVSNTIYLTRIGFYDDLSFHRIIPGFMMQGGCPLGTGYGHPNYRFDGEIRSDVRHDSKGILSAANSGPGTDGSQFFITFKRTGTLDGKHTVYGKVVEGFDTMVKVEKQGSASGAPKRPILLKKATIEEVKVTQN